MITPFSKFRTKEDIMDLLDDDNKLVFPLCENLLFVFNKILDPHDDNFVMFEQDDAPIVGLFHKQVRFFKHYINSYKSKKSDICFLLNRIIYEAYIKMCYLIDNPNDVREYRAAAFKPHLEILSNPKFATCPNTEVIRKKYKDSIRVEGFQENDIRSARKYPGGKNFRQMLNMYENEMYTPVYSMSSDAIHSGWNEIRQMYLRCKDDEKLYCADVSFSQPVHFRMLILIAEILASSSLKYSEWALQKYSEYVPNFTSIIKEFNRVSLLISEVVMDTYKNNPEEYLYK